MQAHANHYGAHKTDEEKWKFLWLARAHFVLTLREDGSFALSAGAGDERGEATGTWTLARAEPPAYWIRVKTTAPKLGGEAGVRIVVRDAEHLEYYREIGGDAGAREDDVMWFIRTHAE